MSEGVQLTSPAPEAESLARRAHRLLAEAREAANGQVALLEEALVSVYSLASEVADGGEVYPVGVRDLARKAAEDAAWCAQTMGSIMIGAGVRRTKVELNLVDSGDAAEDAAREAAAPPAAQPVAPPVAAQVAPSEFDPEFDAEPEFEPLIRRVIHRPFERVLRG